MLKRCVCRIHRVHPVSSCFAKCDRLTRPLCSSPITEPSLLLRVGPPQCSASVLLPRGFGRLGFSLNIGASGSCCLSSCPTTCSHEVAAVAVRQAHLPRHFDPVEQTKQIHVLPGAMPCNARTLSVRLPISRLSELSCRERYGRTFCVHSS